jgi:demethylmenaquinone methyltransferase/2-methoxy-6-polyprenyl-1,4-benzoquinol methylase
MANVFYHPGRQRAAKVNELFDRIAARYDRINDVQSFGLHRCWKRRLVRLAGPRPGELALDVCCGTGDISGSLACHGVRVWGLDFSALMLTGARARLQDLASSSAEHASDALNLQFVRGDALHLPFRDRQFDLVTIGYGLRNLASIEDGLKEMQRVTKPGGRLLILDFGKPSHPFWRVLYFAYLRWMVPLFGRLFCGSAEAYAYILESLEHYPAQQGIASRMQELGLTNVQVFNLLGGIMSIHCGQRPRAASSPFIS